MPIVMISLLVLAYKSKIAKACGYDCLNCKHQPNVCKFLLGQEAKILDTAFSSGAERCGSKTFSILSEYWGLHFVPLPSSPFHHSSCVIYSMLIGVKRVISSDHSSCIYHPFIHRTINFIYVSGVQCGISYFIKYQQMTVGDPSRLFILCELIQSVMCDVC